VTVRLPPPVLEGVEAALIRLGRTGGVRGLAPVGGGCINHGARLDTGSGPASFLKWNASAPRGFFEAEAEGLQALRTSGALRAPEPLAWGGGAGSPGWLLMEYVAPGPPAPDHDERLGEGLAHLHRSADPSAGFGWPRSNWIGSLPQPNDLSWSWSEFWRDRRIVPQLERAVDQGALGERDRRTIERTVALVPVALEDVDREPVHLLHGDLWGGNAYAGDGGEPVVIDPAVYLGHGEVDLAMSELFGGFGHRFYQAYAGVAGVGQAYDRYRRDLYQLYYLLVHVNLFGAGYVRPSVAAAQRVLAELGG
jgi:fructosamine-3-kinase